MKKVLLNLLLIIVISTMVFSCTENTRAKTFGGTATIVLPKGEKLINATWKDTNLWYLTRKRSPSESIESYTFQESSSFGMVEGTVKIIEQ